VGWLSVVNYDDLVRERAMNIMKALLITTASLTATPVLAAEPAPWFPTPEQQQDASRKWNEQLPSQPEVWRDLVTQKPLTNPITQKPLTNPPATGWLMDPVKNVNVCALPELREELTKMQLQNLFGAKTDMIDVGNAHEVSRTDDELVCAGMGYLSNGRHQIRWSVTWSDPEKTRPWIEVKIDE
jgi:hypothetical protein